MFIVALILCGFWNGALGSETGCQVLAEEECRIRPIIPPEIFPGSIKELEADCQKLYKLKECIKDFVKKCMEEGSGDQIVDEEALQLLTENKRLIDVTTEICEKYSNLHSRYVQDMKCFKGVMVTPYRCTDSEENLALLQSRIDLKTEKKKIYRCLSVLTDFNCYLSMCNDICGARARNTATEIIKRAAGLDFQCPDDIRTDMRELVDAWKTLSRKGVYVRELIV